MTPHKCGAPSQARIAKLEKQRGLIDEWRLHGHLDPDERGEWETEDRKGILHQDSRFANAFLLTESAFNAISLMNDPTNFHRDNALAKIDAALPELKSVLGSAQEANEYSAHPFHSRLSGVQTSVDASVLKHLMQRGVDLLNKDRPGVDRSLLDRAAESWIDEVREALESAKPETAVYFTIEELPSFPRAKDQSHRVHEFVQRLGPVIGALGGASTDAGRAKTPGPPV